MRETGCTDLQRTDSIMRFDKPAFLAGGIDEHKGGSQLDAESRALLESLYPPWRDVFLLYQDAASMPGFSRRSGGTSATIGVKNFTTTYTSRAVTGLCQMDMMQDANFRVRSGVSVGVLTAMASMFGMASKPEESGFQLELGAWADTYLYNSACRVLAFAKTDTRFQTGTVDVSDMQGGLNNREGWLPDKAVIFNRPFRTVPGVVAFIAGLDTMRGRWIRIRVEPREISQAGFKLTMNSWAGKL